jgi:hypothetical protein
MADATLSEDRPEAVTTNVAGPAAASARESFEAAREGGADAPPAPFELELTIVVPGAGRVVSTTFALAPGDYTIGASLGCDIVAPLLREPRIARVVLGARGLRAPLALIPLVEGMSFRDKPVRPGQQVADRRVMIVRGEGVQLRLTQAGAVDGAAAAGLPPRRKLAIAVLGLASLALALVSTFVGQDAPAPPPPVLPVRAAGPAGPVLRSGADLERLARSVDIAAPVRVHREGEVIVLEGSLSDDEHARLVETLAAAARRDPAAPPVRLDLDPAPVARAVAGIVLAPRRYVVGRDGARYAEGQVLPGGWRIERIGSERLFVSRAGIAETMRIDP